MSKKQDTTVPQHPSLMDVKPKIEPSFHHTTLQQMTAMGMAMPSMQHIHHSHHIPSHLVPTSQHLHHAAQQIAPTTPI